LDIQNYYTQMQSKNVLLSYKGAVTHELLDCLLKLTESKLSGHEQKRVLKKKVYTIVVEVLQNIYHHFDASALSDDFDSIAFLIVKAGEEYHILAGNYASGQTVDELRGKIDEINALSADELRQRYREELECEGFTDKGGAGLGILYIARKSGEKIEYEITQEGMDVPFFSLKVKVRA
jgi:hypothetical protein